jgi:hypothetical protein
MINFIDVFDNVIGIEIDGKITKTDIEKISLLVEEKLQRNQKLRVYVELKNLGGITLNALLEDLKLAFKHLKDFDKKAVICDVNWRMELAWLTAKLFPHIEVKCFNWSDIDEAKNWLKI